MFSSGNKLAESTPSGGGLFGGAGRATSGAIFGAAQPTTSSAPFGAATTTANNGESDFFKAKTNRFLGFSIGAQTTLAPSSTPIKFSFAPPQPSASTPFAGMSAGCCSWNVGCLQAAHRLQQRNRVAAAASPSNSVHKLRQPRRRRQ